MTPAEIIDTDLATLAKSLRDRGEAFAIATVVRTVGATSAKAGAKALLLSDGTIAQGWIGGGCVCRALAKAVKSALIDGQPHLISLHPQEVLDEKGLHAGDLDQGVEYARNGCPSKGSIDIFVEPVMPMPELIILGNSPVATALASLTRGFQWSIVSDEDGSKLAQRPIVARRMVVVASQGKNDLVCLMAALASQAESVAFVGSRRKFAALSEKLVGQGVEPARLAAVEAPAGLAIDAVTPEEIALSILARLTQIRRRNQRGEGLKDA
jgi:xanthine dehydrogenase accessory factor